MASLLRLSIFLFGIGILSAAAFADPATGRFEGDLTFKQLEDGKTFEVISPFAFVDSAGLRWAVPIGVVTDGASVPRWAWSIFPPLSGKYLKAAVVHDYYCQTKSKPWQSVHRTFYDAMRTAGVDLLSAKTMYAAVYQFGPRWLPDGSVPRSLAPPISAAKAKIKIESVKQWISETDPTLEEIEQRMRASR